MTIQASLEQARLSGRPDWHYVLREIYALYRFTSSGGSEPIRAHMRIAREAAGRVLRADTDLRFAPGAALPATAHLSRALDAAHDSPLAPLARALERVRIDLSWQYGYDRMPPGLARRFAFCEIAGPRAPVHAEDVIFGLVLFAPGCLYPAHAHEGITESYIVLSGAVSENDVGVFAPGAMVFNPPGHLHRITVPADEPALLLYAWTGTPQALAEQKMVLAPPRRRPRKA